MPRPSPALLRPTMPPAGGAYCRIEGGFRNSTAWVRHTASGNQIATVCGKAPPSLRRRRLFLAAQTQVALPSRHVRRGDFAVDTPAGGGTPSRLDQASGRHSCSTHSSSSRSKLSCHLGVATPNKSANLETSSREFAGLFALVGNSLVFIGMTCLAARSTPRSESPFTIELAKPCQLVSPLEAK